MRNVNSRFSQNPVSTDISRSTFRQHWTHLTTMNAGKLYPVSVLEVLPGDTFSMDTNVLARMSTPIYPVMDDAYLDLYHFFVPNRLVWEHWKNFMGENTDSAWVSDISYEVPQFEYEPSDGKDTNVDYMGLPVGKLWSVAGESFARDIGKLSVNAMPLRALRLIWNEWFRDQNVSAPKLVNTGDTETDQTLLDLYPVAKYHDYFTSVLPAPQKGPAVPLPLTGNAPVLTSKDNIPYDVNTLEPLIFSTRDNDVSFNHEYNILGITSYPVGSEGFLDTYSISGSEIQEEISAVPINLFADLSRVTAATVNQLRQAFQVQKLYERDARGGTRYIEQIRSHFGVISPDARMQRPEFLGGERTIINMTQVAQTSAIDGTSPQGNMAAYSLTRASENSYTKSFTEHGFVICVACIRTHQSYQNGINRLWSRKGRLDYYYPVFANLGEQAVLNKEIYAQGNSEDDEVFGYQEAWAEYRYTPSIISGAFRSNYEGGSLDSWHYGSDFHELPRYSEGFIYDSEVNVERTLAVESESAPQFIVDFSFVNKATRKMPMYSIPGLIDHH